MKRSGSALRIRLCALVLLLCCVIGGVGLIALGAQAVQEGNKLERAAGQAQIIYGVVCIVSGVIVRELINGFSTIVAAHESEQSMAPVLRVLQNRELRLPRDLRELRQRQAPQVPCLRHGVRQQCERLPPLRAALVRTGEALSPRPSIRRAGRRFCVILWFGQGAVSVSTGSRKETMT